MAGIYGVQAYQQSAQDWKTNKAKAERTKEPAKAELAGEVKESGKAKVETKAWQPVDLKSSLVPQKTEIGNTIGDVQLSDKAKDYYEKLKSKYHNMEFIAVSKDMKDQVQKNAGAYGNANKMVVLVDEEKLERMANDEAFRKKYEGIIAAAGNKLAEAKNSLTSSGASLKNFGMSVDANGKESFFATVEKAQDQQKKRIEEKSAKKKADKIKEKKKAEKAKEKKKAEKAKDEERLQKAKDKKKADKSDATDKEERIHEPEDRDYVTIASDSLEDLVAKVSDYSYNNAAGRVMTEAESALGGHIDFKG